MWTFNFNDMEWKVTVSSGIQPRPRYRHSAEILGNKMYILGGSDNNEDIAEESKNLSIHELNLDTMQWNHPNLNGYNPFPRSGHSSAVVGSKSILLFGGKRNPSVYFSDLCLIDVENFIGIKINCVENSLPTPVGNSTLSVIGNKCFVFGGTDQKGNCYNDIRTTDIALYLSPDDTTVSEGAASDYCFKIIIIGDSAVGKSSLLTRFSENSFISNHTPTIGIDFNSRLIRVDKSICKLEIWDTAGQERFATMTANY
jgi:N-acetylneuraminic acid mutarotase